MNRMDLGGNWMVRQEGKGKAIKATVPGDVFGDLLKAGEISDPFYRDNELALKWVWEAGWEFSREFEVSPALLSRANVLLRCEGLDTFATILINGKKIAETDNQFRTYEFDVRKLLKPGTNSIVIRFASAFNYCNKKDKERKLPGWWGGGKGMCCAQFGWVRKSACNFGWDWGVKAPTCGIWRDISLLCFDGGRIEQVRIDQNHLQTGAVELAVAVGARELRAKGVSAEVTLALAGKTIATAAAAIKSAKGGASACVALKIAKPELWWPNTMGAQPLYDLTVVLKDANGNALDTQKKRLGLRTLCLDRHKDEWGESFQFVVNGVPYFAKGGNWIPVDGIMARRTPQLYRDLLTSCAQANMNMLRVWGGGIYEDDCFYELCDELGLTIWHDFMFACSTYPVFEKSFLENVRAEATDNVRRIRHHACIAFWNGNNELEQGLVKDTWTESSMSWKDYDKLFNKLLPEVIAAEDPQRDYWPGSPHTSLGDRTDFNNPDSGDAHLWSVWHGKQPFEWYRTCTHRFNSEFGFQSFPEPRTVYGYTAEADRNITSFVMEHHQRSGIGNTTIMQYMLDWFRLPQGFDNLLHASQILQGMAMKYAVEHWRRSMPRGMGTLYWQINDNWPVASWSSIDYHGNWKALQYMAKKFNEPVLISGLEDWDKGTIEVHLTSDRQKAVSGEYRWTAFNTAGEILAEGGKKVKAAINADKVVDLIKLDKVIAGCGARNIMVNLQFTEENGSCEENLVLFARPKHLELAKDPGLTATVREAENNAFRITLQVKRPALWCWLDIDGMPARYSDNYLHLLPGKKYEITVTPSKKLTTAALGKALKIRSLVDTY